MAFWHRTYSPVQPQEPDYSTYPGDWFDFGTGFACPSGHVQRHLYHFGEDVNPEMLLIRKVCVDCGEIARSSVVKRTPVYTWENLTPCGRNSPTKYGWSVEYMYTFVRWLKKPTGK